MANHCALSACEFKLRGQLLTTIQESLCGLLGRIVATHERFLTRTTSEAAHANDDREGELLVMIVAEVLQRDESAAEYGQFSE
jgi:hypothetical protein